MGWAAASLENLIGSDGVFADGDWVESKDQDPDGDVRLVQLADVGDGTYRNRSSRFLTSAKAQQLGCTFLRQGDVLVARMPDPLGRACIFPGDPKPCVTVVDVCIVRTGAVGVDHRWLMYAINAPQFRGDIAAMQSGSTRKRISRGNLSPLQLPLPPLAEQRRIVAAIEEHLSRLDAAVAGLKRVQAQLPRYRAAVLKAAVEGSLVGNGRTEEAGIPERWRWLTAGECAADEPRSITDGPFGSNLKTEHYTESGPRVVRLQNIGDGEFVDARAHISEERYQALRRHAVFPGDVLIAALGENPPRACLAPEHLGPAIVKADCIRLKPNPALILPGYLNVALNAHPTRRRVSKMLHGVGRPRLNLTEIRSISLPVPPLPDQVAIVAEVERRLSLIRAVSTAVDAVLVRANGARQSILARAFSGQLVPQDPNDEPARVLLERIRAGRAGNPTTQRKRGQGVARR